MMKVTVTFCNFANVPKNDIFGQIVFVKITAAVNVLHVVIILSDPHCLSFLANIQLSHEIWVTQLSSMYCSQYYVFTRHI
jgi:hypothetical protein